MTRRAFLVSVALVVLLIGAALAAVHIGGTSGNDEILWSIRAPRVAMALIVGIGLATAGALLQGSLSNPLADPALVGVSAGAALGATGAAAFGIAYNTIWMAGAATLLACVAIAIAVRAATNDAHPEVVTLLLAGVAVTAFASAVLGIVVASSDQLAARSITFWTSGSLALSTWAGVAATAPFVLVGLMIALAIARPLDMLSLGDHAAQAAGVPVSRIRLAALIAVTLLVGAGVAVVGVIAFVGLLVPSAMRILAGPRHAALIVLSALAGGLVVLLADTAARTVAFPMEIPIGAIMAIVGAPVFFVLLRRTRNRQGGWA